MKEMEEKKKKMGFLERKVYNNLEEAAEFQEDKKAVEDEREFQKYMEQLKR